MKLILALSLLMTAMNLHAGTQSIIKKLNEKTILKLSDPPESLALLNLSQSNSKILNVVNNDKAVNVQTDRYIVNLDNVAYRMPKLALMEIDLSTLVPFEDGLAQYNQQSDKKKFISELMQQFTDMEAKDKVIDQAMDEAVTFTKKGSVEVLLPIKAIHNKTDLTDSQIIIECSIHPLNVSYVLGDKTQKKHIIDLKKLDSGQDNFEATLATICTESFFSEMDAVAHKLLQVADANKSKNKILEDILNALLLDYAKK